MTALFDMTAGTSTGSIIAAGLAMPKSLTDKSKGPKFFGDDMIEIYDKRGSQIFHKYKLDNSLEIILVIVFLIVFTTIFYLLGRNWYDNPQDNESLNQIYKVVKRANKIMKGEKMEEVLAEEAAAHANEKLSIMKMDSTKVSRLFKTFNVNPKAGYFNLRDSIFEQDNTDPVTLGPGQIDITAN